MGFLMMICFVWLFFSNVYAGEAPSFFAVNELREGNTETLAFTGDACRDFFVKAKEPIQMLTTLDVFSESPGREFINNSVVLKQLDLIKDTQCTLVDCAKKFVRKHGVFALQNDFKSFCALLQNNQDMKKAFGKTGESQGVWKLDCILQLFCFLYHCPIVAAAEERKLLRE